MVKSSIYPFDPQGAIRFLRKQDPVLGRLIRRLGPFALELRPAPTPFQGLAESIVYQQLHGRAAATIWGRLKKLVAERGRLQPEKILKVPMEELRAAGLSNAKAAAIRDLAQKTMDGTVPSYRVLARMADAEIIERLTQIRGVGPWTVEMLLIFRLGRSDVLPANDFAIRKAFGQIFRNGHMPKPQEVLEHGECWRPYRSVASWYLWRSLD